MNVLVTSAGRRVKIVEYMKESLEEIGGTVIATDCDVNAPAIHFADNYEIVPRIDDPNYIQTILAICNKYDIKAIVSLIDPELELLAKNKEKFDEKNIELILSPVKTVEMAFDKYETYNYLNNKGIQSVPTYKDLNEVIELLENEKLNYPLVVKPAKGSASEGLFFVDNKEELTEAYNKFEGQIIQPFYKDREYGVDAYIDMVNGELVDIFIKEKLRMRSGETDKSISIHNEKIETLVRAMIKETDFIGPIDIDCFEHNGEYYISEINPRFGGGYPHAFEMGCNFMSYIVRNLQGKPNALYDGFKYEKDYVMMKYDRTKLIHDASK